MCYGPNLQATTSKGYEDEVGFGLYDAETS